MSLAEYMKTMKRSSKKDDPIGVKTLDEPCPACGKSLKLKPACCSSKFGTKECFGCGYKIALTS